MQEIEFSTGNSTPTTAIPIVLLFSIIARAHYARIVTQKVRSFTQKVRRYYSKGTLLATQKVR